MNILIIFALLIAALIVIGALLGRLTIEQAVTYLLATLVVLAVVWAIMRFAL